MPSIRELLSGGDLRSIGRVPEVLKIIGENPERLGELVGGLDSEDPVVRGCAADALEKLTAKRPALLEPFKEALLRLARESRQQEIRWHLAQMVPRLPLTRRQIPGVFTLLRGYQRDRSVIVQVCALQAMFELATKDPSLRGPARELVEASCRTGTPAMRARGRKLLSLLKEEKMAYDEVVAERVRGALGKTPGVVEKRMFGGIAFMVRGNMCCGVIGDRLMLRVGPKGYDAALARPNAKPMDFTGRPMKGLVYVEPAGYASPWDLMTWIERALEFALSLPAK